jgi:AcrR family transcriptional regulator
MNSRDDRSGSSGRKAPAVRRGQTRPQSPDTPELAERRAQAPAAQALVKAARKLFAEGGPQWATDKRIHDSASRPGGGKGFPLGTIRYYFGGRERLLIAVARYEQLTQLDLVRRKLRAVKKADGLATALLRFAEDPDHYKVTLGLLTEARQMPELQAAQSQLSEEWIAKLAEMLAELQERGVLRANLDPYALAMFWSSLTAGLAAHRLANPEIALQSTLDLARQYAASLQ